MFYPLLDDKRKASNPAMLKEFQLKNHSIIFESKKGSTKKKKKNIKALFTKAKKIVENYLKNQKLNIVEMKYKSLPSISISSFGIISP